MISAKNSIHVGYPVDQVFNESLHSKHIPRNLGILKLACRDEILKPQSLVRAHIGFMMLKFGMDAKIRELEQDQFLQIHGVSRDAEVNLSFDFQPTGQNMTSVTYDFGLDLKSRMANKAAAMYGCDNTNMLIGGVVTGIVDSVQQGLHQTYGPPLQRPA